MPNIKLGKIIIKINAKLPVTIDKLKRISVNTLLLYIYVDTCITKNTYSRARVYTLVIIQEIRLRKLHEIIVYKKLSLSKKFFVEYYMHKNSSQEID